MFSLAIFAAITLTRSWPRVRSVWLWVLLGTLISVGSYLLVFFTFWVVGAYSSELLRVRPSGDPIDLGTDVILGLFAGAMVAAICVEVLAYVLSGRWSNSFLLRLALAGTAAILVTLAAGQVTHSFWTFYGVLFPLGEGLYCAIVGAQINYADEVGGAEKIAC